MRLPRCGFGDPERFMLIRSILLGLLLLTSRAAGGQTTVCPPEHPFARRIAEKMLTSPGLAREREETGIDTLGTGDLRLLTDSRDAATCLRLNGLLGASGRYPEWRWTAYQVGTFYLISYRRLTPDGKMPHHFPLMILDANLNQLNIFAL